MITNICSGLFIIAKTENRCCNLDNGQTVLYLYNKILLSDNKKQSTDTYTHMAKFQKTLY